MNYSTKRLPVFTRDFLQVIEITSQFLKTSVNKTDGKKLHAIRILEYAEAQNDWH